MAAATGAYAQQPFISTWKTDNSGSSTNTSIIIPTTGTGYNYEVDWNNDGTYDQSGLTGNVTHDFGVAGTYTIRIRGAFPRFYFNGTGDRLKLTGITQWGSIAWTSMESAFQGCENLQISATDVPDMSGVTNCTEMFRGCYALNSPNNIGTWNMSTVTNMQGMFRDASAFNKSINNWTVGNVTNMSQMFFNAAAFNQPLNNWNTINVTATTDMFWGAFGFNQSINSWNTGNVTNMSGMFNNAIMYNQPLNSWNTANVTDMSRMFFGNQQFNQPLNNWNTANVTDMSNMFQGTPQFNQSLSNWNTANVTSMLSMFISSGFNQYIGNWTLNASVNMSNMLSSSAINCSNYSANLYAWANKPETPTGRTLGALGRQYGTNVSSARTTLTTTKGWTISGDAASGSTCSFALPVTMVEFTGKLQGNTVLLEWLTANELNNRGFYVERSTDGRRWTDIGFVAGQGTATEKHPYAFVDDHPLSASQFYRLRQTDFDGTENLSTIVRVALPKVGDVRIYPNPVSDGSVTLILPESAGEAVQVKLLSMTGQVLRDVLLTEGTNTLDVRELPAGVYLLQVGEGIERLVIQG